MKHADIKLELYKYFELVTPIFILDEKYIMYRMRQENISKRILFNSFYWHFLLLSNFLRAIDLFVLLQFFCGSIYFRHCVKYEKADASW